MRPSDFFIQKKEETLGTIREGLRYAKARPDLYVVMALVFFAATFGLNFQIFNALMASKEFGKGPAEFGLLGTYIAVGSLSGALISARLERFRDAKLVMKLGVWFSIVVIVLSIMPTYTWYSFWLPICGISALTMLISANSYVQVNSDPAVRGRVMGIYLLVFMGGTPLGSMLIGYLTEAVGTRETIAICGGFSLLMCVLIWFFFNDKVERPDDLRVSSVLRQ
jgi:MFS family permease